ncbi:hypothetical protein [Sphingosinicella sp. BN140058]|uniref:hypothetical protein n=1 Tax=Sphingosinicella sp. BN140058 TaxID=1892855 RepID=UPI001010F144|nr:hypothetical protein [Sphingosinicella sp. BN140058]QAY78679.1 hypothetical protein ETR14_20650 [Sphingosinicella sp. BN140058]
MTVTMKKGLIGAFRILAGVLIFYVFIVVLMAAISQQNVMIRLSAVDQAASYSSGWRRVGEIQADREERTALKGQQGPLADNLAKSQQALRAREEEYHSAWAQFLPLAQRADGIAACDVSLDDPRLDEYAPRLAVWRAVEQCVRDETLPQALRDQFATLAQEKISFPATYRRALAANDDVMTATKAMADLTAKLDGLKSEPKDADLEKSFQEVDALLGNWLLGGRTFVALPPALVQLILSAAAGAFGALLVTLVLIVYPKTNFTLVSRNKYAPRMLLGALIAVCVYVLLQAGTAVLGTGSGFEVAKANYMTFCAVSILAGMFSDRAAAWLSARAIIFFPADATAGARSVDSRSWPGVRDGVPEHAS